MANIWAFLIIFVAVLCYLSNNAHNNEKLDFVFFVFLFLFAYGSDVSELRCSMEKSE